MLREVRGGPADRRHHHGANGSRASRSSTESARESRADWYAMMLAFALCVAQIPLSGALDVGAPTVDHMPKKPTRYESSSMHPKTYASGETIGVDHGERDVGGGVHHPGARTMAAQAKAASFEEAYVSSEARQKLESVRMAEAAMEEDEHFLRSQEGIGRRQLEEMREARLALQKTMAEVEQAESLLRAEIEKRQSTVATATPPKVASAASSAAVTSRGASERPLMRSEARSKLS
eukprot:TRINITY_DN7905_c0_g1_i2.p1 TRINITY_DN7905_c0_g1~~TRINITY_DN7905_c0_g1_i2.p1  ORF type:complete len:235 (-),score=47.41 TRINITY_DN7905_c0_g1_i2:283-987(-)